MPSFKFIVNDWWRQYDKKNGIAIESVPVLR